MHSKQLWCVQYVPNIAEALHSHGVFELQSYPSKQILDEPHCTEEKLRHTSAQDDKGGKRQSQDLKAHVVSLKVECHRACPWHQGGPGFRGLLRNWKEGDGVYHKEAQQRAALGPTPQLPALALRQLGLEYRTGRRQASQGHVSGMCVVHGVRTAACTTTTRRLVGFGLLGMRAEQHQPGLQAASPSPQPHCRRACPEA